MNLEQYDCKIPILKGSHILMYCSEVHLWERTTDKGRMTNCFRTLDFTLLSFRMRKF